MGKESAIIYTTGNGQRSKIDNYIAAHDELYIRDWYHDNTGIRDALWLAVQALRPGEILLACHPNTIYEHELVLAYLEHAVHAAGGRMLYVDLDYCTSAEAKKIQREIELWQRRTAKIKRQTAQRVDKRRMSRHAPYGYKISEDGRYLVAVPEEQETIEFILSLKHLPTKLIVRKLNETEKHKTRSNYAWTSQAVNKILRMN